MKISLKSMQKMVCIPITLVFILVITFFQPLTAAAKDQPPPEGKIPCGGKIGAPHFSENTFKKEGKWHMHAQASNWCSIQPNRLALGGRMFRSSWRGWIEQPHVGNYDNPTVRSNRTASSPNKFVLVSNCTPDTSYRWRARIGNSAEINGKPAANLNPVMTKTTEKAIPCAPAPAP